MCLKVYGIVNWGIDIFVDVSVRRGISDEVDSGFWDGVGEQLEYKLEVKLHW